MHYLFLFLIFVSHSSESQLISLVADDSKVHSITHESVIEISDQSQDYLLFVENQNLDTFGSITHSGSTLNSASWMGPYGNYLIYIPKNRNSAIIQVQPLESKVSSTEVKLSLISLNGQSSTYISAVKSYIQANDLRIKQYLGHSNQTKLSIKYFTQAENLFSQENETFLLALTLFEKGKALVDLGLKSEGIEALKHSTNLWSQHHQKQYLRAANSLGLAYWKANQLKAALEQFETILQQYTSRLNPIVSAQAVSNAGLINLELGEFNKAMGLFYESLKLNGIYLDSKKLTTQTIISEFNNHSNKKNIAATLNNLALAYDALGDPNTAEQIWLAYIEISKHLSNKTTIAKAQNNLAKHYIRKGEFETARKLLQSAQDIFTDYQNHRWLSLTQHNLGSLYLDLGMNRLAEIQFKKSIELRTGENNAKNRVHSQLMLVKSLRLQGKLEQSELLNQQSLEIAKTNKLTKYIAMNHLNSYHLSISQGEIDQAGVHINNAFERLKDKPFKRLLSEINVYRSENLILRKEYHKAIKILTHERLILKNIWNTKLLNTANNLLASAYLKINQFELAKSIVEDELNNLNFYIKNTLNNKIISNLGRMLNETLSLNALILDQLNKTDLGFIQTNEFLSRFNRSKQLNNNSKLDDQALSNLFANIKSKSESLENRNLSENDRNSIYSDIIDIKAKIDFSFNSITAENHKLQTIQQIQNSLDPHTLIIQYTMSESGGLSWWISHKKFESHLIRNESSLNKLIKAARQELIGDQASYKAVKELSSELLLPLSNFKNITHIKLILDNPLNLIPFSALVDSRSNYSQALIHSTNIQRLSSIESLNNVQQIIGSKSKAIVISDPVNSNTDSRHTSIPDELLNSINYPRLSNTAKEEKSIKSKFNTISINGFDADKQSFLEIDFNNIDLLHIATHAFFHSEFAGLSAIVLSSYSSNGLPNNSSFLRSLDINQLNIDVYLTVLSGCETGVENTSDALGLEGLTHSFINAGSQNIIASLWKVDDQVSSKLMDVFYSELSYGKSINESLREAQNSIKDNYKTRHPKYWSGWFLLSR